MIKSASCLLLYAVVVGCSVEGALRPFCFKMVEDTTKNFCRGFPINGSIRLRHPTNNSADCCSDPNAVYYTNETSQPKMVLVGVTCWRCNPTGNPCEKKVCTRGKVCVDRGNGKGKCACLGCPRHTEKRPVCGTDGETYQRECELQRKACREGRTNVEVAYDGECKIGCEGVFCRKNRTCLVDQYKRAYCGNCVDCSKYPLKGGPVCAADGLQYESSCHLRMETCRQGKTIGVAYRGKCIANATCSDINCDADNKSSSWPPMWGKQLKKHCVQDDAGRPRCVRCSCLDFEIEQKQGVCGTDNTTYDNHCSLRKQMCKTKKFIDVKSLKPCTGDRLGLPNEQPLPATPSKSCQQEDFDNYYITMKHFLGILRKEFGLDVRAPKSNHPRTKVVLLQELRKVLSKKWLKIRSTDD